MSNSVNQIIKGAGFHHIALKVNDFEKSLKFYTEGLGFIKKYSWGEGEGAAVMLDMGDGTIVEMFAGGKDEVPNGRFFHLAIKADDIEFAYNRAIECGATENALPKVVEVDSVPEKIKLHIAFVNGPDNEVLEFFKFV